MTENLKKEKGRSVKGLVCGDYEIGGAGEKERITGM
jgi:hypothetical protein